MGNIDRKSLVLGMLIAVCICLAGALVLTNSTAEAQADGKVSRVVQPRPVPPFADPKPLPRVGRYQLAMTATSDNGQFLGRVYVRVIDTATGNVFTIARGPSIPTNTNISLPGRLVWHRLIPGPPK